MIGGLGQIRGFLGTIQLNGETKLIVNPWAAIGTDALLITSSIATVVLTKNHFLRTIGILGSVWGLTAIGLEVVKLLTPATDPIMREV